MTPDEARKLGGSIHRIMNHTLYRKLTLREHKRVIKLIGRALSDAQKRITDNT